MSTKALAKPSGITLEDHTEHVVDRAKEILTAWPFLADKYHRLTGKDLKHELLQAAQYHDTGKRHNKWQTACQADFSAYMKWLTEQNISYKGYDRHLANRYESWKRKEGVDSKLMKAHLRHEFASLKFIEKYVEEPVSDEVRVAIAAHHSKLGHRFSHRWLKDGIKQGQINGKAPFEKYWRTFLNESTKFGYKSQFKEALLTRFRFDAVRTLLKLADTRASRWEQLGDEGLLPLQSFAQPKGFGPNSSLRPVQEAAVKSASRRRTILRAPTGSGKTYAALLWAEQQILGVNSRADRLIIAMPTRFTSNEIMKSVASQDLPVGLFHSSAAFALFGNDLRQSMNVEAHKFSRLLLNPVSVCTIDHLLLSLNATQENHHDVFYFLANSCVVFDEVDFYDPWIQANLRQLLDVLDLLDVPTMVMSATVPDCAPKQYGFVDPVVNTQSTVELNIKKQLKFFGRVEHVNEADTLLEKMLDNGQGILYANTVERALGYYFRLIEMNTNREIRIPIEIYHSQFTEPDKREKETQIVKLLGREAHENNSVPNAIVVMTQIGEMSINISANLMVSEACPWDRLAQRVGRLARFGLTMDEPKIYIIEPFKKGKSYPAPYAELIKVKDGANWEPYPAYSKSLKNYKAAGKAGIQIDANYLENRVNDIYPKPIRITDNVQTNIDNYQANIRNNWLVVPKIDTDEELGIVSGVKEWKARNIQNQVLVWVERKPQFDTWDEFYFHQLNYGISCQSYRVIKHTWQEDKEETTIQEEVVIGQEDAGENKKSVRVALDGLYSPKVGFAGIYGYSADHWNMIL
ncbi:MAG: CRISPR-associated helicase Cas3' [Bacteroidota bacterium]